MNKTWHSKYQFIRDELKRIRLASNLTQQQLAEKLNRPQSYVSKYESGERQLDIVETIEICDACENYDVYKLIDVIKDKK